MMPTASRPRRVGWSAQFHLSQTITRHISRKKLPTVPSPRNARMIAASAQKPIDADRNMFGRMKKIWLKFERC